MPLTSSTARNLIINGHDAPRGRYPYFSTLEHYCGGALIAPDTILTAGHCLPLHTSSVQPHVGRYSFHNDDTSKRYDIVAMKRHPHWELVADDNFRHDFSLLFLSEAASEDYVRINRDPNLPANGQTVFAMGVGWTSADYETAKLSQVLKEVNLEYLENAQCELSSNAHSLGKDDDDGLIEYTDIIHADHLCTTGGPHNKRDACSYDSGSPIIIQGETAKDDILVGLVSGGVGCKSYAVLAMIAKGVSIADFFLLPFAQVPIQTFQQ
jgi:secreted trypsin-like serine protease